MLDDRTTPSRIEHRAGGHEGSEGVEWVFRHAGGCLIETPPLALPTPPAGTVLRSWVATLWRDSARLDGWSRLDWMAADRGWELPRHLAVGDVVEFGLAAVDLVGYSVAGWDLRWYGWLRYCTELAAVVVGPYPDAAIAADAATPAIDAIRLGELTGPRIDATWTPVELVDGRTDDDR